jgi:hypothetical protein
MMRIVAIILNFILLVFFAYIVLRRGLPSGRETFDWMFIALINAVPLCNLFVLLRHRDSNNWLALYFKRKSLEEKKRILELKKGDS